MFYLFSYCIFVVVVVVCLFVLKLQFFNKNINNKINIINILYILIQI